MQIHLGHFQRLAHAALFMLTGLVLLLFVVLFGSRLQVNENLRVEIQRQCLENAGLAVEIGTMRGNWWSGLTLQDVKVHAGPETKSPLLGTIPLVQVEYTVPSLLGLRPQPMRVDAYQVNAGVAIAANRLFNLQPRPRAPHEEKPGDPPPPVDMVFHGGHVSYEDNSVRKPFKVEVGNVTGVGTLRGFKLQLDLQALREQERINAHVDYDLVAQRGDIQAHARGMALPYWVNRFGYAPEYELTGGKADLDAEVHWKDPMLMEELKLKGTARLWGGEAKIKNVAVPLVDLHGDIAFDQDTALLPKIEGTIAGMPVIASGKVTALLMPVPALGGPDQHLDVTIETPKVELEKLSKLWPGIKGLGLAGLGSITSKVGGTTANPHVVMQGRVPSGHYGKEPCTKVLIDADYTTGRFDLPHYALDVADGHAEGKAFVGIPELEGAPVPYTVDATFKGAQIAHWFKRYMDEPLPFAVDGRLAGDLTVRGLGGNVKTDLALRLADGHLAHAAVQACTAAYHYATPTWTVPQWSLDWGKTHVTGSAHGGDNSPFRLDFKVAAGELAQWVKLNREPPKTRIEGLAFGEGGFGGPAADPNRWTGGATLHLPAGIIDRQTFTDGNASLTLANNVLTIAGGEAHTVGGLVRAHGTYGPFMLKHNEYPTTDVDISAVGMKLGLVGNLPESVKTAHGELSGRFNWFLHDQDLHVTGRATVEHPRLPGWAHVDRAVADFRWTPTQLSLRPLVLAQGADRYEISGTVGQVDETYPMDLRVRAPRADVKTLLAAVQWPDVMAKLQPQRAREGLALGPVRDAAGLPREAQPATQGGQPMTMRKGAGSNFQLAAELDRWLSYKKAPMNRAPAEAPLLPFWQESSGKFWIDAHVTGPIKQPAVSLAAAVKQLRVFDRLIDDGSVVLGLDRDRLSIPRLRLVEGGKTILTAGGALSDRSSDALVIRTFGLDLGWTKRALATKQLQLEGKGDLTLRLA
ncbi:MAG: hypothetical protein JWM80_2776, partial [Cyanobacteria bacterium RYN_339]|nr:hypothetical protein [Cyanobacteria bacterium RYN_339]